MKGKLSPHKDDLKGPVAYIMMPSQYNGKDVHPQKIYAAIKDAVKEASGLAPEVAWYRPLNAGSATNNLGKNQRGTAATLYDPKYKNPKDKDAKAERASEIYVENKLQKQMT